MFKFICDYFRSFLNSRNHQIVLIRKTVQPSGVLSEIYFDGKMESFAYDTYPAGEQKHDKNIHLIYGHNKSWRENTISVPQSTLEYISHLMGPRDTLTLEIIERWALKV